MLKTHGVNTILLGHARPWDVGRARVIYGIGLDCVVGRLEQIGDSVASTSPKFFGDKPSSNPSISTTDTLLWCVDPAYAGFRKRAENDQRTAHM
jgi:hypothetical protein